MKCQDLRTILIAVHRRKFLLADLRAAASAVRSGDAGNSFSCVSASFWASTSRRGMEFSSLRSGAMSVHVT